MTREPSGSLTLSSFNCKAIKEERGWNRSDGDSVTDVKLVQGAAA